MIDDPMPQDQALGIIRSITDQRQAGAPESFPDLVRRMRAAQARYFQTRAQDALVEARRLERLVDTALRNLAMSQESQP